MRSLGRLSQIGAAGLLMAVLSGCGGSEAPAKSLPATVPATGVVRMDGKPLSLAMVLFVPSGQTKGVECIGFTDDDGKFSLEQIRGSKGAPPGEYRVVVSRLLKDGKPIKLGPDEFPANIGATESLPPKFSSPSESMLVATVPAGGGEIPVDLKGR